MHTKEINFNVRFDEAGRQELEALADRFRCSRAEVLRRIVNNAYNHITGKLPCCADGGRCFVPQMHTKNTE